EQWSPAERAGRFEEFVELTDLLLRDPAASYEGRWYSANEGRTYPGCVQRPRVPFAVAATGPRGMRLAARYGETWVTTGDRSAPEPLDAPAGASIVARQIGALEEACVAEGRDPSSIRRLVVLGPSLRQGLDSPAAFVDTVRSYEEVGVTDVAVHWPRDDEPYQADRATFEAAVTAELGPRSSA
ncbi:MAG TPA: LLM class flavin-dependent oxidoreductase, partial [Acidimicrobiia bacterium]|nr:LLM class flavin-dependent oxidoreductase [Acidimicrobiia bacterium]